MTYCERFLELVTDLEAQLPTRRFFNTVLDSCNLVVHLANAYNCACDPLSLIVPQYCHTCRFAVQSLPWPVESQRVTSFHSCSLASSCMLGLKSTTNLVLLSRIMKWQTYTTTGSPLYRYGHETPHLLCTKLFFFHAESSFQVISSVEGVLSQQCSQCRYKNGTNSALFKVKVSPVVY